MSLSKEALQHLEQSHKTGTEVAKGNALILGQEFKLADLEKYQDQRRRFRGVFETAGLPDFTAYVGERAEDRVPVFIDRERMAARCYLDIGLLGEPGHCEHHATLTLPKTPEYQAFLHANGSTFDQEDMVALIEDWGHLLTFTNAEGEELERAKVLTAFRKVSMDDLTSIDSEKQEHSSQVGVMNRVTVKHAERLPTVMTWRFASHDGLDERVFAMRVSTHSKGPSFRLRAMSLDAVQKEIAEEFAQRIKDELAACECLLGTFAP